MRGSLLKLHSGRVPACLAVLAIGIFPLVVSSTGVVEEEGWSPIQVDDPETWMEEGTQLPHFPEKASLVEVEVADGYPFRVYLDTKTLTVAKDGVVRYTVVLKSSGGARNILFEGIHCSRRQYRRYAYGIDEAWSPFQDSDWGTITGGGQDRYRFALYRNYLCDTSGLALSEQDIRRRLRAVGSFGYEDY
jgi:hypothetical protein